MKLNKLKFLIAAFAVAMVPSFSINALENDNNFEKYSADLEKASVAEELILEVEEGYNDLILEHGDTEAAEKFVNEFVEKIKNQDYNSKKVQPKKSKSSLSQSITTMAVTASTAFPNVEAGDIILEPDRAGGFGHTSMVHRWETHVYEALSGQKSQLNRLDRLWYDTTSRQRWMYVPRYSYDFRRNAANQGDKYLNLPYSLTAGKDDTTAFYCSKLNWRQYKDVGVDLDVDGGPIVFPYDIYNHPDTRVYISQN